MNHFYSPNTGEYIATNDPADWMQSTAIALPTFDPATQGVFFRGGAWVVVTATPLVAPVPASVTMRQARLALLDAGLLTTVNNAVAGMTGAQGEAARIEWEYSQEVHRDRGLVAALGATLGLTAAQLDALFVAAHAIP